MFNQRMKDENEFRSLLTGLIDNPPDLYSDEAQIAAMQNYNRVSQMIQQNLVSSVVVLNIIVESIQKHPRKQIQIFSMIRNFAQITNQNKLDRNPEFLWAMMEAKILHQTMSHEMVENIVRTLIEVVGANLTRSYLNYLLIKHGINMANIILFCYYYTDYDVRSFKVISEVISISTENIELYEKVFAEAKSFVLNKASSLSTNDKQFLTQFFKEGFNLKNTKINDYCQISLKHLMGT